MSPSASELKWPMIQRCARKRYLAIQLSRLYQTRRKSHGWNRLRMEALTMDAIDLIRRR